MGGFRSLLGAKDELVCRPEDTVSRPSAAWPPLDSLGAPAQLGISTDELAVASSLSAVATADREALAAAFGHLAESPEPGAKDYSSLTRLPAGHHNNDPSLNPLRLALNDKDLTQEDRASLLLRYRNEQAVMSDFGTLGSMQMNAPSMPAYAGDKNRGLQVPLVEKMVGDPAMQEMMERLSDRISGVPPEELDIASIFADVQADARNLATPDLCYLENSPESNLFALQAMATLFNAHKFKDHQLPPQLREAVDPVLWEKITAASDAVYNSQSGDAAVMSHGSQAAPRQDGQPFSIDNNFHFFSHAYLTANLVHEHGLSPNAAEATSGLLGSQYELQGENLVEDSGNSALKDVLMNAEGARFGTDLIKSPSTDLPEKFDGPAEDRSIGDTRQESYSDAVKRIIAESADRSTRAQLKAAAGGFLGRQMQTNIQMNEDSKLPVRASPRHQ